MAKTSSNSPNVVAFFTDHQRRDTAGIHGNPLDLNVSKVVGFKSGSRHLARTHLDQVRRAQRPLHQESSHVGIMVAKRGADHKKLGA